MDEFCELWIVDFEFCAPPGERYDPICVVAYEARTGREVRLWQDELRSMPEPPYSIGPDALFIAYFSTAEFGCHLQLGWELPANVLDLYAEFRNITNGKQTPCGAGLLGASAWYGLSAIEAAEKESMRQLALRGGPWSNQERLALLDYCAGDVSATAELFKRMTPDLDSPRALLRGRYMKAAAHMEYTGVPIDAVSFQKLRDGWTIAQDELIRRIDADYGVFEDRSFKTERFARWLEAHNIAWPMKSGKLGLDDETFRGMVRIHPQIAPLREVRYALSQMRLAELAVGADGRNRCLLSPFRARTGRNQPSNTRFIFGPSVWLRSLIQPPPGCGLAYIDYSQQEFGIAAALSRDSAMIAAYQSGDPYLSFAKQARAAPPDATKSSHASVREQFKACALAVQYGMSEESLATRIGQPTCEARALLRLHHEMYRKFWRWSDAALDFAMLTGSLHTVFGWQVSVGADANPRALRNFPMQANGAEILRLACCLSTERGITVCAPIHDAMLIEAPADELAGAVEDTQKAMAEASAVVLDGFELRSDANLIYYPERYQDERGKRMWGTVWEILEADQRPTCAAMHV